MRARVVAQLFRIELIRQREEHKVESYFNRFEFDAKDKRVTQEEEDNRICEK